MYISTFVLSYLLQLQVNINVILSLDLMAIDYSSKDRAYRLVYQWIWGLVMFSVWGWFLLAPVMLEMIKHVKMDTTL